jgi:hypothetical protein
MSLQAFHTDISPSAKHNPIHGGVGVYIPVGGGSALLGTIACTAVETRTKKNVILSNQHAFFPTINGKRLPVGTIIFQRGGGTIGKTYKTIAENNQFVRGAGAGQMPKLGPYHDSALAEATVPITNWINGIGPVNGITNPKTGMKVKFFGATSGLQKGTITNASYNTITLTTYNGAPVERVYKNMIAMDITIDPGDSGSLVVSDPDNKAVGLLWGREKDTGIELAGNIVNIAKVYGIEIGGQSATTPIPIPTPAPVPTPIPVPTPTPAPAFKIQDILLKEIDIAGHKAPVWLLGGGIVLLMGTVVTIGSIAGRR